MLGSSPIFNKTESIFAKFSLSGVGKRLGLVPVETPSARHSTLQHFFSPDHDDRYGMTTQLPPCLVDATLAIVRTCAPMSSHG